MLLEFSGFGFNPQSQHRNMSSLGARGKNWCFTLNNYTSEDVTRIANASGTYSYCVFGKEVGESGTPHLQGFVLFANRVYRTRVVDLIGQCHLTLTRNIRASIEYCKKDGDYEEYGSLTDNIGERNDLKEFKADVCGGNFDVASLMESHSLVFAKYPKFVDMYIEIKRPTPQLQSFPLYPWQSQLYDSLKLLPEDRIIYFIVNYSGNNGKSWFARYYCSLHNDAQILIPAKKYDMAYLLSDNPRVVFFDCPRSKQGDFIQYDFLEEVKNGYVVSPKYQSRFK